MSKTVQTKRNQETFILEKMQARGGEGEIWTVEGKSDFVAKIFLKPDLELEKKLDHMVSHPPRDRVMEKFRFPSIAWPTSLLYTDNKFTGYLMPQVSGGLEIIEVYNPTHRKKYPEFNWKALVHVAGNLATAVHTLHQYKYVIGDINPKNIFVARQTTLVTIIDTDSFQVKDDQGNTYPCKVATPLFIPPELTNTNEPRKPEHDYFGLGVMIFYLLMEGFHPFSGSLKRYDDSITQIEEYLLAQKIFPYEKNTVASPQPHAPAYSILPQDIQNLFHRCFATGLRNPATRPNAREWLEALKGLENSVVECKNNHSHYYSKHLSYCPWCPTEIIQEPLKPPQPKPPPVSPQPKPVPPPPPKPTPSTSAFWPVAIVLAIICFVCGVIVLPNMWGTGSANVGVTATAQARATATTERRVTLTAQVLVGESDSEKQVATAEARATATSERRATLTEQALIEASASQKQTATVQAYATATAERKVTLTVQARATATAEKRQNATAQARTTATAQAKSNNTTTGAGTGGVSCNKSAQGEFADLWRNYQNLLGCPIDTNPLYGQYADMPFEKGHLFWIGNIDTYGDFKHVIATYGGQDEGDRGSWSIHPDTWYNEPICNVPSPPEGRYLPDRGIAKVWCEIDGINSLGFALAPTEFSANRGINAIQNFDKAVVFRDSDGHSRRLVYILFRNPQNYVRVGY